MNNQLPPEDEGTVEGTLKAFKFIIETLPKDFIRNEPGMLTDAQYEELGEEIEKNPITSPR